MNVWTILAMVCITSTVAEDDQVNSCDSERLVIYKLTFATYWDRQKFPRQYPEWRPPAQWSKLVGKMHVQVLARPQSD